MLVRKRTGVQTLQSLTLLSFPFLFPMQSNELVMLSLAGLATMYVAHTLAVWVSSFLWGGVTSAGSALLGSVTGLGPWVCTSGWGGGRPPRGGGGALGVYF